MTPTYFSELMQHCVWMILLMCAPILGVGMVVGLGVSIFQAVTQIQEATLSFVPKIFATLLVLAVISPWLVGMLVDYSGSLISSLADVARQSKLN